ncbi:MAG: putative exported lipoprotein [Bacteroidetes bacterium]|nr:putative exported lipoprotein [Bacteroidota bacterium]
MKKVFILAAFASVMLAACSSDDSPTVKSDKNELGVSALVTSSVSTRAMVDNFAGTNKIGIFVSGTNYTPKVALYTFDGTSTWSAPTLSADKIYLSNETATVYGFYPADATINGSLANDGTNKVDITVPATQNIDGATGIVDYMYATAALDGSVYPLATASNETNKDKVDLVFHHALSKISFVINKGESYSGNGKLSKITLANNTVVPGTPRFSTGNLTMAVATGNIATLGTTTGVDNLVIEGTAIDINAYNATPLTTVVTKTLFPPMASTADITLKLVIDGKEMSVALPATAPADKWLAGKNYTYTVTVNGTNLIVNSVTILGWDNIPSGSADVQ